MNYVEIYILSVLVAISLIIYGKRTNAKAIKYIGVAIVVIDIVVPIASFIAGFIDGINAN